MSTQITILRPVLIAGAVAAVNSTPIVADSLAQTLVWRADASFVTPPTPPVDINDDININSTQIADATPQGKAILTAGTLDAFLTAFGGSLGAADSGGAGFKLIRVTNAST